MSVKTRVIIAVVGVFLVGMLVLALAARQSYISALDTAGEHAVEQAAAILRQLQEADEAKLSSTLRGLLENPEYRELFLAGDRDGLYKATAPAFEDLKKDFLVTHWYFETTEESPTVFLRVHKPEQFGDELKRKTYLKAVESKGYGAGLELGQTAVALRAVHPYYSADGKTVIGYMELGQEVDRLLEELKKASGNDAALLLLKSSMDEGAWVKYRQGKGLENNWDENPVYVVADATSDATAREAVKYEGEASRVDEDGELIESAGDGDGERIQGVVPVADVSGDAIGVVFVDHDIRETSATLMRERFIILGVVVAMLVVLLGLIVIVMNRLIFKRLDGMISGMEDISTRLAGGDFDVHYTPDGTKDEIGRFEDFFSRFIDMVAGTLRQLTK